MGTRIENRFIIAHKRPPYGGLFYIMIEKVNMTRSALAAFVTIALIIVLNAPLYSAEAPSFNYNENDPADYKRAKNQFTVEYQQVVDYLNKTESNSWGYTDILNLWDYRESLRKKTNNPAADPDNLFTIARQVKRNVSDSLENLGRDVSENEEYYQIKLLMMIAKPNSEFKIWNPLASAEEKAAMNELKNVINTLKRSGGAVELVEKEFGQVKRAYQSVDEKKRLKALNAALSLVRFRESRCRRLIDTRKMMYEKGLLPASQYPDYPPFMDLECCRYWTVNQDGKYHVTGYYYAPSGKKVDYTSEAIKNFNIYLPHAGMFALKSGNGYHIYTTFDGPASGVPVAYVVAQLGEEVSILHKLQVYKWLNETPPPDYSYLKIKYQTEKDGPMQTLTLE